MISAARRLSGMANLLDLGAIFGEKIRGRFVQSTLISKELQSKSFKLKLFVGHLAFLVYFQWLLLFNTTKMLNRNSKWRQPNVDPKYSRHL
jgi:hypothetical protein